jgi:radical SAM protein with 4Fe4S-binding SPASM domain
VEKIDLDCAVWEITLACNMNCKHCGSRAGIARPNELTTKECYSLCEELAEIKCNTVSLMGGEPFIRKDWHLIAGCVKDLGMKIAIVSNGLLMPQVINKIDRLEPRVVGISLDGTEKTHDTIRRKGSYKAAIKAIDLLREHGIQTTIITTLSKANFDDLLKIKDILSIKDVNWQIQVGMPFGNFDAALVIDEEEYYASAMFIASEGIKNRFRDMPVVGAHCYGYFSHLLPTGTEWSGCTAGISTVGITSDGSIVGCLSIGNNQFIEGNIRKKKFIEIWEDPDSFKYNRRFKTKNLGKNCQGCHYGNLCKGGCNSVSLHLTGQFHTSPLCLRRIEETKLDVKPSMREKIALHFLKTKK